MFELSFKTLRAFGFLPFIPSNGHGNTKNFSLSKNWLVWSYILHLVYIASNIWRFYYYTITLADVPGYGNFIYDVLVDYDPLINLLYGLAIFYPVYGKNNQKKLQKCVNLLAEIQLQRSSQLEKTISFITIALFVTVAVTVEIDFNTFNFMFVETPIFEYELDIFISFFPSLVQTLSLMFSCTVYCVLLKRLENITVTLDAIAQGKNERRLKFVIKSYFKCTTLINTFAGLNFYILRNIWLHCVYDLVFGIQGYENVVLLLWCLYNVPLAFFLFNLGSRLEQQVIQYEK